MKPALVPLARLPAPLVHATLAFLLLVGATTRPASAASLIRFRFITHAFEENAGDAVIEVWRTGDTTGAASADFATVESAVARAGEDFTATAGTLNFAPGVTNLTVRIPLLNDALQEPNEAFQVQLANPSADTTLGSAATVTIRDNDGIRLEFSTYRAGEHTDSVTLALVRGPDETGPASVDYLTADLSAIAGADYQAMSGTAGFGAGERVALVRIPLLNDALQEPSESFRVNFSNPAGGSWVGPSQATVTILDNDPGVGFLQNRRWVHEDQEGVLLEVGRGNDGLLEPFTVDYTVVNGTAVAGEDFTLASGRLSFAAGEMIRPIRVPVVDDGVAESDENFRVVLSNPNAGPPLGSTTNLTVNVTICDATGMVPRRMAGIRVTEDGLVQLDLQGGVHRRFLPFYSVFQLEESSDLATWRFLRLLGHRNSSTNPPAFTELPSPGAGARFYRVNPTPFVTPSVPPTGPYAVGITRRLVLDPNRRNRFNVSTNAPYMVAIWYPASPRAGAVPDRYEETILAEDVPWQQEQWMDEAVRFGSYAFLDAPVTPRVGGHPVVLHSHGLGGARYENMERNEHLASHGYVVVAISHADAGLELFPDGTFYRPSSGPSTSAAGFRDRVEDLRVTLDELARLNGSDPVLAGALDLNRVGAMGVAWGAATAAEFCRNDPRGRVTILLDGGPDSSAPELSREGLPVPLLMLNSSGNSDLTLFNLARLNAYWAQLSNTVPANFGGYDWFGFPGDPAAREATRTITAYVVSFLNKHLKGNDDHLLDAKSAAYPRVSAFRRK